MGIINEFYGKIGITKLKYKPAYNPYTEPSLEVFGYHPTLKKWVEIGNSGVFRPEMLRPMGLPEDVNVIAWGLSLERPTMIHYNLNNIRDLFGHKVALSSTKNNKICYIVPEDKEEIKEKKAPAPVPKGKERTYIMIKPDGVQRGLIGKVVSRFEKRGFKLCAMKMAQPGKEMFEKHYEDLNKKPFFGGLVEYAASGPVCCMVWEGDNVVLTGRKMLGATKPFDSNPGTIRGDFCIDVGRNVIHGSDCVEAANKEIDLWFDEEEQV